MSHISSQPVHTKKGGEDMGNKPSPVMAFLAFITLISLIVLFLGAAYWAASKDYPVLVGIIVIALIGLLVAVLSAVTKNRSS